MVSADPAEAEAPQWPDGAALDSNFPHKNTGLVYSSQFNLMLL